MRLDLVGREQPEICYALIRMMIKYSSGRMFSLGISHSDHDQTVALAQLFFVAFEINAFGSDVLDRPKKLRPHSMLGSLKIYFFFAFDPTICFDIVDRETMLIQFIDRGIDLFRVFENTNHLIKWVFTKFFMNRICWFLRRFRLCTHF